MYSQSKNDSLAVNFHLEFNKLPLELNKKYVSASKDTLSIDTFRCYISNIQVQYEDNTVFTQKNSYHLLDLDNPNSFQIPITKKSDKVISKITFEIGIDSITNTSGAMSGDLDPIKGMYWAWQSGYINMKIEGKSSSCKTRKNEFQFHIGGYLQPYYSMRKIKFELDKKTVDDINIGIDLNPFFSNLELKETNSVMIPGKEAMKLANYETKMFYFKMKRYWKHIAIISLVLIGFGFSNRFTTPLYLDIPDGWPKPTYDFTKNPLTEEGFQLGRSLFYDPLLSRDKTISCASCHLQNTGFTHIDHSVSHGIEGRLGKRNSLALINLAWSKNFMWDGGVNNLEVQPINPITNPLEMDEKLENVISKLEKSQKYKSLFAKAFGDEKITSQRLLKALAQFTVMLKSSDSKYDKVMRHEVSFTNEEEKGYELFKINCASCHKEPLFCDDKFENNGLKPDPFFKDGGRIKITKNAKDSLRFKVPTLRNIEITGPYMHDGSISNLSMVLFHYTNDIYKSPTLSKQLNREIVLNEGDKDDLIQFLKTLTDESFLKNPRFQYPR